MVEARQSAEFSALTNATVLVTAVVYALLLRLAASAGWWGFLLGLMVLLSLWRYGYAILRHTANGWRHFPPPSLESMNIFGDFSVVLHSLLFASLQVLLATTPLIEGAVRWPLLAAVMAVCPASIAVMAMTRSAISALHPGHLASLIRDLGADYVRLLAISSLLGLAMVVAALFANGAWILGLLADVVTVWVVLALFLATGAALRAHRFELDLVEGLDDAEQRDERERQASWQRDLDRAYASVRSGLLPQAYRTVKDLIAREGESLEVYQWTFNGMLAWDEPHHAVLLGERFARRLWDAGRKVDALELAERCRKLSPQFLPPAAFTAELAAYARSIGRHSSADDLTALAARGPQAHGG